LEEVKDQASRLTTAGSVLIDRKSRKEFSPRDLLPGMRGIGEADVGREAELGGHGVRIVGHFEMGIGLAADGAVLMNPQGFARVFPGLGRDRVSIGLVSVTDRRQTAAIAQRLRSQLPADVSVLT